MEFNTVILDCDILVYRCGFSVEKKDPITGIINLEPLKHALYNVNHMIKKCLELSNSENYVSYLTKGGKSNFRFGIYKYYKENRVKCKENCGHKHPYDCGHALIRKKPYYYGHIREFICRRWNAEVVEDAEADDACSIAQYELNSLGFDKDVHNSIIWSIDKDFDTVPGWHGNYITGEIRYVSQIEAIRAFYLQILTGDVADGIPRIKKGWRQKEVEEKIRKCTTEEEINTVVKEEIVKVLFNSEGFNEARVYNLVNEELLWRGRIVHLQRLKGELWTPLESCLLKT